MCKILCVVYFSLFLVNMVESFDVEDGSTEDVKLSKHHHHHKAKLMLNKEVKKTNDGGAETNPSTTEEPKSNIQEKNTDKLVTNDNFVHSEEPTHENITRLQEFERTAYTPKIISLDSLIKTQRIRADESSSDDYSDSYYDDKESNNVENVNSLEDDSEHGNDAGEGEVLINTPHRETLSQDVVLDLKARSGHIQSEDDDSNDGSNLSDVSEIGNFTQHDNNLRLGYILPADVNVLNPPKYVQNTLDRTISPPSNDHTSHFHKPDNPRPEMLYNAHLNSRPSYSPMYFESINSREMLYPTLNSHENWAQGNSGQRTKSYFGSNPSNPSNQMYTRYHDRCPKCTQERGSSRERSFRRSLDETPSVLETANGRSVEFDLLGANAYPLAQDNDAEVASGRVKASTNDIFYPGLRDTYSSHEVERSVQLPNVQSDPGPFSKVLLTLPSYVSRSGSMMRRVGLGGLQRFDNMNKWLI